AVPDWLIEDSPGLRIEVESGHVRCASGLQLGIRYAADLWQDRISDHLTDPKFEYVKNRQDFWRIAVLDKWLGNCDSRQAVFTRRSDQREYYATFIDYGYCFNGPEWTFPDLPLHGVFHRNSVYRGVTGWDSFEPALSWAESFDSQTLWTLASEIPPEWYQCNWEALSGLVESLYARRSTVRDLIVRFRDCSRDPFPDWKENRISS
ncbi:MAG TPA: phosphatidylinositol kinase, partial [Candidatus Angelobacter sp.]